MRVVRMALSLVCLVGLGCGQASPPPSSAPPAAKSSDGDAVLPTAPAPKKK